MFCLRISSTMVQNSSALSFFLLVLMMTCFSTAQQTQRNISTGSSLTASDDNLSWASPSGDFAFGFRKLGEDGLFLLAIWFNKIPERTIVWSANGNNLVGQGSKVELTQQGLVLSDPKGNQIWSPELSGTGVSHGAMLDIGNFVVANRNSNSLWESFSEPTDTLLSMQTMAKGTKLIARYSEANYSAGRFHFIMQTDGNLRLYTRKFPLDSPNFAYWSSDTVGTGFEAVFNQSGFFYLAAENGTMLKTLWTNATSTEGFYQRVIIEHDGVLRLYVHPKRDDQSSRGRPGSAWTQVSESIPSNICLRITDRNASGICGLNSYCELGNDQRKICRCPSDFVFLDKNDEMRGCAPSFEAQSCDEEAGDEANFDFFRMENADWPGGDYERIDRVSEDWCRNACLRDCFCAIAVIWDSGVCWKKRSPISNGYVDSSFSGKSLIKIRRHNSTSTFSEKKNQSNRNSKMLLIGSIIFNAILFVVALLFLVLFNKSRKHIKPKKQILPGVNLRIFTYEDLQQATNGFKEKLGSGAYATVYKGSLGSDIIAVKKLDNKVEHNRNEFEAEVITIGRTNHKNLVKLIGFCEEGPHKILVYEYMSNGSLASFLFEGGGGLRPSFEQRMQIAVGTARGLLYLHDECSAQIMHCDIKPQNVLLDNSFSARISDFGLAKILKTNETRTTTRIRGTKGYVAPEWFRNMPVTAKVDVYSFGIVLLELICCRKNLEVSVGDEGGPEGEMTVLADLAYDCYAAGEVGCLVEGEGEEAETNRVEKYVMIAIWCIQEEPSMRPTMKKVLQMLEGTVEVSVPPSPTSFISSL